MKICTISNVIVASSAEALSRFGYALSDSTRTQVLLTLRDGPAHPSALAQAMGVSRQAMSNHLTCLRGCGLVVGRPDGRRTLYELTDARIGHALTDLIELTLVVDQACCGGEGTKSSSEPGLEAVSTS